MSTLTARDVRTECISVAQLMFLERSRAFYFERCSRVASSNTRITKHFFSSERELRETFERNREKKRKEKKSKNKKRKQERMREPSYSRKLGRTNQAEFESELAREIRGVLFACPHFFLLEKSFVEAECVFLIENAMMTSSSWQLLREYVNYEKREIQIEKMEKEKRVRVVFEGKKQSADEQPSLKVVVLIFGGGGRISAAAKTKTNMTWNRDGPSDAMEFDSRSSSSLSMRQQYNIARSIIAKNQNVSKLDLSSR